MSIYNNYHKKKITFLSVFLTLVFLLSVILLVNWQLFNNEDFIAIANERYHEIKIPSVRGSIKARDGSTLAYSEPRFDVYVWMPELELIERMGNQTREEFVTKVAESTNLDKEVLSKTLSDSKTWIKIASKITVSDREKLLNQKQDKNQKKYLQGYQLQYVNKRIYPESKLTSHVLGFVGMSNNSESIGVGGLEQYWEGSLKPFEGFETGEYDSFGNPITLNSETQLEAKEGVTLRTTIDKILQSKLENKLKAGLEKYQAKTATGIIMNPKTGEILAMANYPDYDPNYYYDEKNGDVFGNMAITVPYEIGSIAKVFTLAAALETGGVTPETMILKNGHKGCEIISPNPKPSDTCMNFESNPKIDCICTWDKKAFNKPINTVDALINSDNIAFRHIALTMNYEQLHYYLNNFGVGKLTGVDINGESTGVLKDWKKWNYADQAVYSYGHGYQITPLQAITGVAAIANEGQRMQPFIVSRIESKDGTVKEFNPRKIMQAITAKTSQQVTDMMHEVYLKSLTEKQYKGLDQYYIGMKSGTALVPYKDRPGYSSNINTTYVGFDASPEKKFIMLIKLEEPKVGNLSTYNARLVWLDTFIDIKDYLGVPIYKN